MTFDDIDTPLSDELLSGDDEAGDLPPNEPEAKVEKVAAPEVQEVKEEEKAPEPAAEAKPEREPVIPRARFDELNAKLHAEREETERLRALLEQNAKPDAVTPAPQTDDIEALEAQYFDAMIDGDRTKAVAIRSQINRMIQTQAETEAAQKVAGEMTAREQRTSFESAVSQTLDAYPFLDSASPDANMDAIADVIEWRDFYINKGATPAAALQKAAAKIGPMYAETKQPTPEMKTDTRKQDALKRNLADAESQAPAPVAGIGNRAVPTPKVETQKDWDRLTEQEREALLQ